ncbi:non-ribosomal peptide synthase/polyketide synthase [Paenibacillus sp. MER TA 81-3]|uniref:non-ribosomal peptide synthase/polyketide synthase n=1 Tax=Paenibacillus sp. MER TA 81-3 TaxID=2939573 RepID=UPI00203D2C5D|nr:non-ribosomal peptide synthase/polyketide synthase [Paenibacillus sp. MER TA 81-3]MCM3338072.1 non-ribosomal peptide synthase/polyketide synthase [Paenibacillus sp. MER TA 81-3]
MSVKNVEDFYPLSPAQQGMLFHSLYAPESGVYVIQISFALSGLLQVGAMESAWKEVVERHATLRTSFATPKLKQPIQVVNRSVQIPLEHLDLQGLSAQEQAERLEQFLLEDRKRGFVLYKAPLLRTTLIRQDGARHQLIFTAHHLLLDGWSLGLVLRDFFTLYEAHSQGKTAQLDPCRPYRDYVSWLNKQDMKQAEHFWRETLRGFAVPTAIGIDRMFAEKNGIYEEQFISVPTEATAALHLLAKRHRLTVSTIVQGAWALLLRRYSGEDDVVFGSVVSGRPPDLAGVEEMVGMFINTLPVRVRIDETTPVLQWLLSLQEQLVELRQYEYSPLVNIQGWSELPRGSHMFDSIVAFESYPFDPSLASSVSTLTVDSVHAVEQTSFPLTVTVLPGAELGIKISFDASRYAGNAIKRLLDHLYHMLVHIVRDAEKPLAELSMLTAEEAQQMLVSWNENGLKTEHAVCIHHLIQVQAASTPHAEAFIDGEERLTYEEVDRKSNQMAHYLRKLGVGPEVLVGVCMERSSTLLIALLGILKAGGAYVPLDPAYPKERLRYIMEEAQVPVLISEESLRDRLPDYETRVVFCDREWASIAEESDQPVESGVAPDNLAYVIYTSGSTGRPKGVMIEHRNTSAFLAWCREQFTAEELAGVLASTSINFDLSIFELFLPLTCGGKVILAENALYLAELPAREEVTLINSVPSAMAELIRIQAVPASVRTVNLAGEPLPFTLAQQVYGLGTVQKLYNLYGPSEDTTYSTWWLVEKEAEEAPPIGRPIAGSACYILDRYLQPVPIGVTGELYIAGAGLARGYLQQEELTKERFVPNPFAEDRAARMYRTGDLCRYREDGVIEYLGRIDDQVKLRGFRIELGEVQTAVSLHPEVREAAVMVREDVPGQKRLVAYMVPKAEGSAPSAEELRGQLKERLPDYMVPAAFVVLEALPLTPNGKVDRKALPAPEWNGQSGEGYVAPRNPVEETLCNIWAEVLGVERVGIHDNFFELGGDSIVSIQIVSQANRAKLRITPRQMFEHRTVASLAEAVGATRAVEAEQDKVTGEAPLLPVQQWFFEQQFTDEHHWNQAMLLVLRRPVQASVMKKAVAHLLHHHDALRLRFRRSSTGWQAIYANDNEIPFEHIDLSQLPAAEQAAALEQKADELQSSLDLVQGPLLRVAYFDMGKTSKARVLIILHHLIADGVSWRILLEDLQSVCECVSRGELAELQLKTTSYKKWAEAITQYAQSGALESEWSDWLHEEGEHPVCELPLDVQGHVDVRSLNTVANADVFQATLDEAETESLLRDVPANSRAQVQEVLLTALVRAMGKWTGQRHASIELEGHGREEIFEDVDISRTVGWFTSMYPVSLRLDSRASLDSSIKQVKEKLRRIPNRGLGYGLLKHAGKQDGTAIRLRALPQPPISFNYLGQFFKAVSDSNMFETGNEAVGSVVSKRSHRIHLLNINVFVQDEKLQVFITYCRKLHQEDTIATLARAFQEELCDLIAYAGTTGSKCLTPSDFPLSELSQVQLDRLIRSGGELANRELDDLYTLAPLQEGMLFQSLLDTKSHVYLQQSSFTLRGKLNVPAFEQAWQRVAQRHAILRTSFVWEGMERAHQVVHRTIHLPFRWEDWREHPLEECVRNTTTFLEQDRNEGFNLNESPLMRISVFRIEEEAHLIVWTFHHLLLDGWSAQLVLGEVFAHYEALATNRALQPAPVRPYHEYIGWLKQQSDEQAESYWRSVMAGFETPTPLGLPEPAYMDDPTGMDTKKTKLSQAATASIQSMARSSQLTLGTIIQGAWAYLLSRYSGESDVVFGVTLAGRPANLVGVESMVGLFINTLPLRVKLSPEDSIAVWLEGIQQQLTDMRQYEYSPLVRVQGWSEVERGLPLFESLVVLENYPVDSKATDGSSGLWIEDVRSVERPDLPLTVVAVPGEEMTLSVLFERNRFSPEAMERMLGHLQMVLEGMTSNPMQPLSSLEILTEREREQLIVEWNDTAAEVPEQPLHELFIEQAAKRPDDIAVISKSGAITYRELDALSNSLSYVLCERRIQREELVPIMAERSPQMIIAMLAVLKAGGAYVPIDPTYPRERIELMLEDSEARLLLVPTREALLTFSFAGEVLSLEELSLTAEQEEAGNLVYRGDAADLAYMMYTSGSTGRPKGVMVEHRNIIRLVKNVNYMRLDEHTRILQSGAIVFDATTFDIWGALLNGGRLYLTENEVILDGQRLKQEIESNGINTMFLTTALLHQYATQDSSIFQGLDTLISGGESMAPQHVNRLIRDNPRLTFFHAYGPTENTTYSTIYRVTREHTDVVPIGRPISNSTAYVVDKHMNLLPVGVAGELLVGGDGVARGYWKRPDLTEKSFIASPFRAGERCYHTGDLVRMNEDGQIEFIGRIDDQVKIRGFRIEPSEIESVILTHPDVHEVVVTVREDQPGDKRLVAYLVVEQAGDHVTAEMLRQFVKGQLPEPMIPSAFVILDALPLTINGKVDRKALPAPDYSSDQAEHELLTPIQELLVSLWSQVLGVSHVRITDDFFLLGGHSLMATQLISRIREVFKVDLPLRAIFDYPTIEQFSVQVEAARKQGVASAEPMVPVVRPETLPLSYAQQRLWFLDQLEPDNRFYNIYTALRFNGYLQIEAFERSLNEIVKRHETFRTTFVTVDGSPRQVILSKVQVSLPVVDLTELAEEKREEAAIRLAAEEVQRPFNLATDRLIRVTVLKLSDEEHVVVLAMHHIISDGWSMSVFVRELGTYYEGFCNGESVSLPELSIQYADYAIWQREWLQGNNRDAQLSYWKQKLAGIPAVLELPADYPRPPVQTFSGALVNSILPNEVVLKLAKLSREEGATLYMTLLTAFHILLHRYSGQDSLCVGIPVANRNRPEIEGLIGFFVNMLPIRADFTASATVRDMLQQVRETTLDAFDHQDLPFEQLVEVIQPERSLTHSPLFQVIFDLQTKQMSTIELPGLSTTPMKIELGESKFDLGLTMAEIPEGMLASFNYNTDLFQAERMERMMEHFCTLLEQMAEYPDRPLAEIGILTDAEIGQVLLQWNATTAELPDMCTHERFEQQAVLRPDAVSLVVGSKSMTYRELNERSNQLAHHLRKLGVAPEVLVGICAERSVEFAVALLAVFKAGGVYVPIDPEYPQERIAYMMDHSKLAFLLTQEHILERLPSHEARTVCLDSDWSLIEQEPVTAIKGGDGGVTQENAAYVIYTSGSTGKPKGVIVTHGSLLNHNLSVSKLFGIRAEDRVLQFATISFDVALEEFFSAWTSGATVVMAVDRLMTPAAFSKFVEDHQLTVLNLPSAYWHEWVRDLAQTESSPPACVRAVIVGSERPSPEHLADWRRMVGDRIAWFNAYGPSEATITSTVFSAPAVDADGGPHYDEIPIGRPIANTQIYLLDAYMQPVPVGVPGELYIGGKGLARGYLNQPDLTAERFVQHPLGLDGILYRTGDLARYTPDGNIEYLGRTDYQVKIRGFRIELGEVETALGRQPHVQDAIVMAREDRPGEKRLVAYTVPQAGIELDLYELRNTLKEQLPTYMVPAIIVPLSELPMTPAGKVDRRALPAPDWSSMEATADYAEPRNKTELQLCRIWEKVLGIARVGIYDNFFELGGDSILSIQIVARSNQAGLKLTPRQMFQYQTVAELATVVEVTALVPAEQGIVTGEVPLTPIQQWFFEQPMVERHHWNQAVILTVAQPVNVSAIEQAIVHLLHHHDALRAQYSWAETGWVQKIAPASSEYMIDRFDLSALSEDKQRSAVESHADKLQASLNLAEGPLFKAALFDIGATQPARLLLIAHHLVVDGVSWRIILEDVLTAYTQLLQHQPVALPLKTTSYSAWSTQLQSYAQQPGVLQELSYWLAQSGSAKLPLDYAMDGQCAVEANTFVSVQSVEVSLAAEETRMLLQDMPTVFKTQVNDVLLTALVLAVKGWTGQESVLIHLEGHGREEMARDIDLSRTVGWFTAVYPIKLDVEHTISHLDALKKVKEQLRRVPQHGIGYGLLRYLSQEADVREQLAAMVEPQIIFNYLGQFDQVMQDGPLSLAYESTGTMQSPLAPRSNPIEINAAVSGGKLHLTFMYSENLHKKDTLERLAAGYVQAVRDMLRIPRTAELSVYTPSDFPQAVVDQQQLDTVIAGIGRLEDLYVLSPMQKGMLFHTLYTAESTTYFEQTAFSLKGNLDVPLFRRTWQEVINRHSILRTQLVVKGVSEPHQAVLAEVELPFEELDWQHLTAEEQAVRLSQFLQEDINRGFDLSQAPLMRVALFKEAADRYSLVWSHHHLLIDGWSVPIILSEVVHMYESYVKHAVVELSDVRPYRDYIAWLHEQDAGQAQAFWQEMLRGISEPTPLPMKRPSPSSSAAPGWKTIRLSSTLSARLNQVARTHKVTLNTVVQAAWAILLSRYSGTEEVIYGTTVSGRPAHFAGVESMVGLFINTLPVRLAIDTTVSIGELLQQLQVRLAELNPYEYTPLWDIQAWSDMPRGVPLFDSIIVFENYPIDERLANETEGQLDIDIISSYQETNFALTFITGPGREIPISCSYDAKRFDMESIERLLSHMSSVLEAIAEDRVQTVDSIQLLTQGERDVMLGAWNATALHEMESVCIHEQISAQAAQTPNRDALIVGKKRLTYEEVDHKSNQMAHYLRKLGVGPEVLVGVCMERSSTLLIALLGILKAGGAYVPLDPAYPKERLRYIMEEAQVPVLISEESLRDRLPDYETRVVFCDREWASIAEESDQPVESGVAPDNLAYVIYTSGSTGRPKGVMIEHRNTSAFLAWCREQFTAEELAGVLASTSINFDLSIFELFLPLTCGGKVILAENALYLAELPAREEVTLINSVPSAMAELIRMQAVSASVRTVNLAGEPLPFTLAQQVYGLGTVQKLYNLYGPSEDTTYSTWWLVEKEAEEAPPIGRPIAGSACYILDRYLQPVPIGVTGELYIAGAGLARGYLQQEELTKERFVPNPFAEDGAARMYRTGDLCRYREDGIIEYLGRIDDQVKLRGFRIELGEVQTAVSLHPEVREAAVMVREDVRGQKRLVAYMVPKAEGSAPSAEELRGQLKERLPDYMVPAAFVVLEALPLTPNGKVDRKALPAPEWNGQSGEGYVDPRNPVEETLCNIWAEMLGVERVGIHDNFFELGGDSIVSIQIIFRCAQAGLKLTPKDLFDHQTIALLAEAVRTGSEQGPVVGDIPLTPMQHWFFELPMTNPHHANQSRLLTLPESVDVSALTQAIRSIIVHHDALRLRFTITNGIVEQRSEAEPDEHTLEFIDLFDLPVAAQKDAIKRETERLQRSMNVTEGPIVRAALFDLGPGIPARLFIAIHQLAVDHSSWNILLQDLQTAYEQLCKGEPVILPLKTASFKSWSEQLQAQAHSDNATSELAFWMNMVEGEVPELPVDRHVDKDVMADVATMGMSSVLTLSLTEQETADLLQQATATFRIEAREMLLASFAATVSSWTAQRSLFVDVQEQRIQDNVQLDLSRTVGCFSSQFPLRLELGESQAVQEVMTAVKEQLRRVPDHGIGYGLLRYVSPDREIVRQLSEKARPSIRFTYVNPADQTGRSEYFGLAQDRVGADWSEHTQLDVVLHATCYVENERLHVEWRYNTHLYERATIERLIAGFTDALRTIILQSQEASVEAYSAVDFAEFGWDQSELDGFLDAIKKHSGS